MLYVICGSRGSLTRSTITAGHSRMLCDRENDGFDSDVPARSRSNAVTDAETAVGGRHVVGRDGETTFSTRDDLHSEEDRSQGGLVGVVQGVEREPDTDGAKQRSHDANVRCLDPFAQVYWGLTIGLDMNY
jgi:hypothetical protein